MSNVYQIIKDSSHTQAHQFIMSKLEKNCTVVDYANKYAQLWKDKIQASKLAYTLKNCDNDMFDQIIFLLQNNTAPAFSTYGSTRSWIHGVCAIDWDKDFEPLMMFQAIKLSTIRYTN